MAPSVAEVSRWPVLIAFAVAGACFPFQANPQNAGYVDPAACAGCHAGISATYGRTGMARSFYRARPENTPAGAFYHESSDEAAGR